MASKSSEKKTEKMDVDTPSKKKEEDKKDKDTEEKTPVDQDTLTFEYLKEHIRQIERGEAGKEPRFLARVLRLITSTRKRLNDALLNRFVTGVLTSPSREKMREFLCGLLSPPTNAEGTSNLMEVDKPGSGATGPSKSPRTGRKSGTDIKGITHKLDEQFVKHEAEECANDLMKRIEVLNRRSVDPLAARVYFYSSLIAERTGQLPKIRPFFHARLRTATLHHETESQAVLINCLLRGYLAQNLYDLAGKLVEKAAFPESANNNEWARHFYYLGLIKGMQLEYGQAEKYLEQAMRKAPQHGAVGFKQSVQKCKIVVDLLLGTIPERSLFRQPIFRKSLVPYLQLTQAVRTGDVGRFNEVLVLETFGKTHFQKDGTYSLIVRLRQNVMKTAVKQLSVAYSRISIPAAQKKLQLSHPDDAEYIIAKAIKDGVIEAGLNHREGYMQSAETADVYSTTEPQHQYHTRIAFCLELHNQAVKAMRFPPKAYNKDVESAEEQREREQQELEFAKEMAEDDDDFP